jgi:7-keto-8-aminopelargonate synthetase-like enzyme
MIEAFSSYGRSVAVIFACAFAVFFAQEAQSQVVLGIGALIAGASALVLWLRLRGTHYRFLVGVAAVVAITFLTFQINKSYPDSGFANVAAFVLFASLAFFSLYAFLRPPGESA